MYYAAEGANGELRATEFVVGKVNPESKGLKKGLKDWSRKNCNQQPCREQARSSENSATRKLRGTTEDGRRLALPPPKIGNIKNLVIPIRFADHKTRTLPSVADLDILMNSKTPHVTLARTGSVWSVFDENSYGMLSLDSTVVDWVDTKFTEAQVGDGTSG
jgi:hypothetical protein